MNIHTFLEHHGINRNPFAEEDAQTDPVFKEHCISNAYHPIWDKVYGDPHDPSTSIIFGPKGSGKTAMRLQIDRHLMRYSETESGTACVRDSLRRFQPISGSLLRADESSHDQETRESS